jgi:hypothetical protein
VDVEGAASSTSHMHAEGAASSTDGHAEDAASPGVLTTSSPRAEGTKEWVPLQVGDRDPEPHSLDFSVSRIFRIRRLEDDDDDPGVAPLSILKRTALQVCSGYLIVGGERAKNPALDVQPSSYILILNASST